MLGVELELHAVLEDDFFLCLVVGAERRLVYDKVVFLVGDVQVKHHFHGGLVVFWSFVSHFAFESADLELAEGVRLRQGSAGKAKDLDAIHQLQSIELLLRDE